jgi:hypothetical protein
MRVLNEKEEAQKEWRGEGRERGRSRAEEGGVGDKRLGEV